MEIKKEKKCCMEGEIAAPQDGLRIKSLLQQQQKKALEHDICFSFEKEKKISIFGNCIFQSSLQFI